MRLIKIVSISFFFGVNSVSAAGSFDIKGPSDTDKEYSYARVNEASLSTTCGPTYKWGIFQMTLPAGYAFYGHLTSWGGENDAWHSSASDGRYPYIGARGPQYPGTRHSWMFNDKKLGLHWLCGNAQYGYGGSMYNPARYTIEFPSHVLIYKTGDKNTPAPPRTLSLIASFGNTYRTINYEMDRAPADVLKGRIKTYDVTLGINSSKEILLYEDHSGDMVKGVQVCFNRPHDRKDIFSVINTNGDEYNNTCLNVQPGLRLSAKTANKPPVGVHHETLVFRVVRN